MSLFKKTEKETTIMRSLFQKEDVQLSSEVTVAVTTTVPWAFWRGKQIKRTVKYHVIGTHADGRVKFMHVSHSGLDAHYSKKKLHVVEDAVMGMFKNAA